MPSGAVLTPEVSHALLHLQERAACPSPNTSPFEDDEPVMIEEEQNTVVIRHHRPTPMRTSVANAALFYAATERLAIPFSHVHAAVQETQEWYDKFLCYLPDRAGGARNPSPNLEEYEDDCGSVPYALCKKRVRYALRDKCGSSLFPFNDALVKPIAVRPTEQIAKLFERIPSSCASSGPDEFTPSTTPYADDRHRASSRVEDAPTNEFTTTTMATESRRPVMIRPIAARPTIEWPLQSSLQTARDGLLHALSVSGGDTSDARFQECLAVLNKRYLRTGVDVRNNNKTEGTWLTLTKPIFQDCLGENDHGDPLYTLGRMGFDMFTPGALICSLQGNFNLVQATAVNDPTVPEALKEHVQKAAEVGPNATLRTYTMLAAFTIEPPLAAFESAPNRDINSPVRGILSTEGYILADPVTPNRHSVWITSGRMEANDCRTDQANWKRFFSNHCNPDNRSFKREAKQLASKLLLGADLQMDAETMEYRFRRPLGGHGAAYIDTLYLDESLRIIKGHRGTIFVFSKLSGGPV